MEEVSSLWFPFLQITLAYAKLTERKQKQELQNTKNQPEQLTPCQLDTQTHHFSAVTFPPLFIPIIHSNNII